MIVYKIAKSSLSVGVKEKWVNDLILMKIRENIGQKIMTFYIGGVGVLRYQRRVYVDSDML